MVKYEDYGKNKLGVELVRAYSDEGLLIARDGVEYVDAIDPRDANRQYEETETPIDVEYTDEDYAEAGKILLGVE